jgi:hypothetical protein
MILRFICVFPCNQRSENNCFDEEEEDGCVYLNGNCAESCPINFYKNEGICTKSECGNRIPVGDEKSCLSEGEERGICRSLNGSCFSECPIYTKEKEGDLLKCEIISCEIYMNYRECEEDDTIEEVGCKWVDGECFLKKGCYADDVYDYNSCKATIGENGGFCEYNGEECKEKTIIECEDIGDSSVCEDEDTLSNGCIFLLDGNGISTGSCTKKSDITMCSVYLHETQCGDGELIEEVGCKWVDGECFLKKGCYVDDVYDYNSCKVIIGENGGFCEYNGEECKEKTITECDDIGDSRVCNGESTLSEVGCKWVDGKCIFSGCEQIQINHDDETNCYSYGCVYDPFSSLNSCRTSCTEYWEVDSEQNDGICRFNGCSSIKGSKGINSCKMYIEKEMCMILGFFLFFFFYFFIININHFNFKEEVVQKL